MNLDTWLTIIGFVLAYSTLLIAAWIKINVKIREIEMRLLNLRDCHNIDITNLANLIASYIDRTEKTKDENKANHQKLLDKIDEVKETVNQIKIELVRPK